MLVIKKNGNFQNFETNKMKLSMMGASDDIDEPLNESDLKILSDKVMKTINSNYSEKISSADIHKIVIDVLNENGFANVAKAYEEGSK